MREIRQYGSAPGHTQLSNDCQCDLRRLPITIRQFYITTAGIWQDRHVDLFVCQRVTSLASFNRDNPPQPPDASAVGFLLSVFACLSSVTRGDACGGILPSAEKSGQQPLARYGSRHGC